jgi:hypothetical protein
MILRWLSIFAFVGASPLLATTWQTDGSASNVQFTHDVMAVGGDTLTLPIGTFTWSSGVSISKSITLQGAGIGQTVIKDAVQGNPLIQCTLPANSLTRITGIEFQDGGRVNYNNTPGWIHIDGKNTDGSKFRFDHNRVYHMNGDMGPDTVIGVIDHNDIVPLPGRGCVTIFGRFWGGSDLGGDPSWAAPCNFGSSQFLFIEDNTFTNTDITYQAFATDAYDGARFCVRHNNMVGMIIGDHGTESHGRGRGSRAMEIYSNNMNGNNVNIGVVHARSSTVLFHDNTVTNYWAYPTPFIKLEPYRCFFSFSPWGGGDGVNVWDVNSPTALFSGTAASPNNGRTVTVTGANWTANQWKGYVLRKPVGTGQTFGEILSNTSTTLTWASATFGPEMTIAAGDSLEIRKVTHLLDQPGRGQGSLITGNPPILPQGWNNQVTEPCYSWNNSPQTPMFTPNTAIVKAGVHYFDNTPMPGYTPYVYPHPLTVEPCAGLKPIPTGAYELMQGKLDSPLTNQTALDRPSIDGIKLKADWADIEQTPGVYNWTNLDNALAQVRAKGKKAGLSVNGGSGCPAWLYQAPYSAQSYTLIDTGNDAGKIIPIPGDPVYLARWTAFISR